MIIWPEGVTHTPEEAGHMVPYIIEVLDLKSESMLTNDRCLIPT